MTLTQPILPAEQILAGDAPLMSLPVLRPPSDLFARRAARLRQLADGHAMAGFLRLCAVICQQQQALHDASQLDPRAALEKLAQALAPQLPSPVQASLDALLALDAAALSRLAERLLNGDYPADGPLFAALPLLGAALQAQATRSIRQRPLPEPQSQEARCPCCGGLPLASVLTRGDSGHAQRHVVCSMCSHAWPVGRVRCLGCGNSRDLRYYSLAPQDYEAPEPDHQRPHQTRGAQEVEACGECHGALKQVSLLQAPDAEAGADDLASLALDLLAGEAGYARLGFNPLFLPGT
ncbi:formate dehydrogenase accessory protein FdhE domain-containing protein [Chromobacterium amazonense]|uniref:formate dehydrogenase accessory protein FdhE domain-containing protein n=1 Tax=Chromobacterium amazonense TaxID=1382803 RepID=UPI003F7A71E4